MISHLHADHFLDLVPYAYALTYAPRQHRAGRPLARHGPPACPRLHVPPGARDLFRRVVGAWGDEEPDREGLRPARVRPGDDARDRAAARALPAVPHYTAHERGRARRQRRRAHHLRRRLTRPPTTLVDIRARHRPAADRGHAAAARARGPRGHIRPPRPASTAAARAPAGWCSPTSPTSSTRTGAPRGRGDVRRRRSRWRARAPFTRSDGTSSRRRAFGRCQAGREPRDGPRATDGVRLLSHRPSVLYKIEHLAPRARRRRHRRRGRRRRRSRLGGPPEGAAGDSSPTSERACLYAVRLDDDQGLPLPADTLLDRARTDWFPEFLSHGLMTPHFQPIVDLSDGRVRPRGADARPPRRGEVRGGELIAAAEAHDALFSFDTRARAAALEVGLRCCPPARSCSSTSTRARARRRVARCARLADRRAHGGDPRGRLELIGPERYADRDLLVELAAATASAARSSRSTTCPAALSADLPQDAAARRRQDRPRLTAGIQHRRRAAGSSARSSSAPTSRAAGWSPRASSATASRVMRELGVDLGQGFYSGSHARRPVAVDARLVPRAPELGFRTPGDAGRSRFRYRCGHPSATCSRTSSACGARWTSCSATSSTAARSRPPRRLLARRRRLLRRPAAGGRPGRPRGHRPDRRRARDPRPRARARRPPPPGEAEGRVYQQLEIEHGPFRRVDRARRRGRRRRRQGRLPGRHPDRRAAGARAAARSVPIDGPDRARANGA